MFGGLFIFERAAGVMLPIVQVSRTPECRCHPRAREPASEKRQGTKSRGVGQRRGSGRYGDLTAA